MAHFRCTWVQFGHDSAYRGEASKTVLEKSILHASMLLIGSDLWLAWKKYLYKRQFLFLLLIQGYFIGGSNRYKRKKYMHPLLFPTLSIELLLSFAKMLSIGMDFSDLRQFHK
mmetsp:Transcript_2258/g.4132  ORF Transcript_2258/g.4132 Transcript_2258/m.4132 type:complete len:113 (-) Transcript_2258:1332-1670(-)